MSEKEKLIFLRNAYLKSLGFQGLFLFLSLVFLVFAGVLFSTTISLSGIVILSFLSLVCFLTPITLLLWTKASFVEFFGPAYKGSNKPVEKKRYFYVSDRAIDWSIRLMVYVFAFLGAVPLTGLMLLTRFIGLTVVFIKLYRLNKKISPSQINA